MTDAGAAARAARALACSRRCCAARRRSAAAPPASAGRRAASDARPASTGSPGSTTPSSTRASTRSTPSCAAPAARRRPRPATCSRRRRIWWRILLDPGQPRARRRVLDARSSARSRSTEAWTAREPDDAEAWFYLGGAYAARVQWRVLRDEKLAAARDGKRIKQALERADRARPDLEDAYFGIGLYRYYADVAPAAAKILRFLLLLPGGDRTEGLAQMLRARDARPAAAGRGRLPAPRHLSLVRAADRPRARAAPRRCSERYPATRSSLRRSPRSRNATSTTSPRAWRLARAAGAARASSASTSRRSPRRRRGSASRGSSRRCYQTDRAIEQLRAVIAPQARRRRTARWPLAYLALGEAQDRLGRATRRSRPTAAPSRRAPTPTIRTTIRAARRAIACAARRTPARAEAYRLSLEGWRALERRRPAGGRAARSDAVAGARTPHDPVAHYRYARVLQARRDDAAALAQFEAAIAARATCPAPIARRPRTSKRRACTSAPARRDAGDRVLPRREHALRRRRRDARRGDARARAPRTTRDVIARDRARRSRRARDRDLQLDRALRSPTTSRCAHF